MRITSCVTYAPGGGVLDAKGHGARVCALVPQAHGDREEQDGGLLCS